MTVQVESRAPWTEAQHAAVNVIGQVLSEEAAAAQASGDLGTSLSGSESLNWGRGRGRGPSARGQFGAAHNGSWQRTTAPDSRETRTGSSWRSQQPLQSGGRDRDLQQGYRSAGRDVGNTQYQQPEQQGQYSDRRQGHVHRGRGRQGTPPGLGRGSSQEGRLQYRGRGRGWGL